MFDKKEKRFEVKEEQQMGLDGAIRIIVDKLTGVHYLSCAGAFEGITPLLDENGKVVVDKK